MIRDAGCESFCHALASSNSSLIELSLAANGMTDVAAGALGTMLASNTGLCRLDLSANIFGEVIRCVVQALSMLDRIAGEGRGT